MHCRGTTIKTMCFYRLRSYLNLISSRFVSTINLGASTADRKAAERFWRNAAEKGGTCSVTLFHFLLQAFSPMREKRFRGRIGADILPLIPSFPPALPEHRERLLTILQSTSGHPPVRTEVFDPTTSGVVTWTVFKELVCPRFNPVPSYTPTFRSLHVTRIVVSSNGPRKGFKRTVLETVFLTVSDIL